MKINEERLPARAAGAFEAVEIGVERIGQFAGAFGVARGTEDGARGGVEIFAIARDEVFPSGCETRGARGSEGQILQAKALEMAFDVRGTCARRGTPRGARKIMRNAGAQRLVKEFAGECPAGRLGARI